MLVQIEQNHHKIHVVYLRGGLGVHYSVNNSDRIRLPILHRRWSGLISESCEFVYQQLNFALLNTSNVPNTVCLFVTTTRAHF